jgi:hypothetical protein
MYIFIYLIMLNKLLVKAVSRIMKFLFLSFIILLTIQPYNYSQGIQKSTDLVFENNYRIYPSNVNQWEVSIVKHPSNPEILFASANAVTLNPFFFVSEGIYVTTNGGTNWRGNDTCTGQIITFHGGDPGIIIDKNGTFILTRKGATSGIYSHFSNDNGFSWSDQKVVSTEDIAPEKASLVSDTNPMSTYYGRSYASWVKLALPFPVMFVFTDDGGQNWSSPEPINNPAQRSANSEMAIDPTGKIYVCWAALTNSSPFTEDYVGFATSNDGGDNWAVEENIFDMNGIAGLLPQKSNIRVNGVPRIAIDTTGGQRDGWIYIITVQKDLNPAGTDADIVLNRSTNGGQTWSQGIRVNQDLKDNGKIQLFPAINVDKYGGINILFYDDRKTTSDSLGIYLARSDDGGNTWREFEISDHNFRPQPIGGFQGKMGDNIGITSSNEMIYPVWMDNSTGIYQIWTVPIEISSVDVKNEYLSPGDYLLNQNYPNPFNPSTIISWESPVGSWQTLKIYDALGNEIVTLVNEYRPAGKYQTEFSVKTSPSSGGNTFTLKSGIYFYQLRAGNYVETRKMLLLK